MKLNIENVAAWRNGVAIISAKWHHGVAAINNGVGSDSAINREKSNAKHETRVTTARRLRRNGNNVKWLSWRNRRLARYHRQHHQRHRAAAASRGIAIGKTKRRGSGGMRDKKNAAK